MYGKFHASAFTGSMRGSGSVVFAVWAYVIANTNQHSVIEINPDIVAFLIGCEVREVNEAIQILCNPDPRSRSTDYDGRRLIKDGEFQYFVPTHKHYRAMKTTEEKQNYNRMKKREERERKSGVKPGNPLNDNDLQNVKPDVKNVNDVNTTEAEAEAEAVKTAESGDSGFILSLVEEWNETAKRAGIPKCEAVTKNRTTAAKARFRDPYFKEHWRSALVKLSSSPFCKGDNDRGWKATFDWFIKPETVINLCEGKYSGTPKPQARSFYQSAASDPGPSPAYQAQQKEKLNDILRGIPRC